MGYDGMDGDMGGGERMGQNPEKIAERYRWGMQWAKREGKRGMVMGIRKDILVKGGKINVETEGMVVGEIGQGKDKWRIIGVYVSKGIEMMSRKNGKIDREEGGGKKDINRRGF